MKVRHLNMMNRRINMRFNGGFGRYMGTDPILFGTIKIIC